MKKLFLFILVLSFAFLPISGNWQVAPPKAQAFFAFPPPDPTPLPPPPPPPTPTINSWTASPAQIAPGQSSSLSWNVSGATSISVTPGTFTSTLASGSLTVTPGATTTYTLTATNANGPSSRTTSVTVSTNPPAPTLGMQLADSSACNAQIGVQVFTSGGVASPASDANNFEPNCMSVYINSGGPFSMDMRVGIRVGDQSGGSCSAGSFGAFHYSPWISQGGGWTGWSVAPHSDPDCYQMELDTQPLPPGFISVTNVRFGSELAEGNSSCYSGAPSQPGVPVYSYGNNTWSAYGDAAGSDTPDCGQLYLGGALTNTGQITVQTNLPTATWSFTGVADPQGAVGSISSTSSDTTSGGTRTVVYRGVKGGYKINVPAVTGYNLSQTSGAVVYNNIPSPQSKKFSFKNFLKDLVPTALAVNQPVCDVDCFPPPPGTGTGGGGGSTPPPNGLSTCPSSNTCNLYVDSTTQGQVNFFLYFTATNCQINVIGIQNGTQVATGVSYTISGGTGTTFPATSPNETHSVANQPFTQAVNVNGDTITLTYSGANATIGGYVSKFTGITDAVGNSYGNSSAQLCKPASADVTPTIYYLNFQTIPVLKTQ